MTRGLGARSVCVGLPLRRPHMEGKKPGEPTDVGHHLCSRAWSKGTCGVERLEHERRYLEVASAFQVQV